MDDFDNLDPDLEAALAAADRLVEQRRRASLPGALGINHGAPPSAPGGSPGHQAPYSQQTASPGRQAGPSNRHGVPPRQFYAPQGDPSGPPFAFPGGHGGNGMIPPGGYPGPQVASPGRQANLQRGAGSPAVHPVGSPVRRQNLRVSVTLCEGGRVMARSPYNEVGKELSFWLSGYYGGCFVLCFEGSKTVTISGFD